MSNKLPSARNANDHPDADHLPSTPIRPATSNAAARPVDLWIPMYAGVVLSSITQAIMVFGYVWAPSNGCGAVSLWQVLCLTITQLSLPHNAAAIIAPALAVYGISTFVSLLPLRGVTFAASLIGVLLSIVIIAVCVATTDREMIQFVGHITLACATGVRLALAFLVRKYHRLHLVGSIAGEEGS